MQGEDVFPRNEILADFSPSLHDSYESRSRILGEYGRGMLEPSEAPSVRGVVGYIDSVRHEENARWFDGKNVVTQLYANVKESHFLIFLVTSLDVPQRRLYKAIGNRGLFINADHKDPPMEDLYGHGGVRHLTVTLASAANSMKRTSVHPIAYLAVNAEPSHE